MSIQDELRKFHNAYPLQRAEIERKEFFYRYHSGGEITIVLFTGGIGKTELFWELFQSLSSEYSVLAGTDRRSGCPAVQARSGSKLFVRTVLRGTDGTGIG